MLTRGKTTKLSCTPKIIGGEGKGNLDVKGGQKKIITSESVNIGHPDKTCDTIADSILDEALRQDPNAQMAVECAIKNDKLFIYGEVTSTAQIDFDRIAKEVLKEIGYETEFKIIKEISEQSPDINKAVVKGGLTADDINGRLLCANDQGIVYGYATNETAEFMPLPIVIAHKLMKRYEKFRHGGKDFFADAKSQVSIEYDGDKPKRIHTVLLSASHSDRLEGDEIREVIRAKVIDKVLAEYKDLVNDKTNYIINPSGKFTIWGSYSDSGCTGRKIVVDTYGGVGRVGGGCFSSKNATKVDRSGAYYARYAAKNLVAHNLADKCEIQVSYGIGLAEPISINIDCFGTERGSLNEVYEWVNRNFSFRPNDIINELDLLKPQYKQTACYGHFGRDEFAWEKIKDIRDRDTEFDGNAMKILLICSKVFYGRIPEIQKQLEEQGHQVFLPNCIDNPNAEKEAWAKGETAHSDFKAKMYKQSLDCIEKIDAVLVLNYERNGRSNYIGGATFLEIYEAFMNHKKVFLMNPVPDGMLFDEIQGMSPIIIGGDFSKV
ncbi:MAG: methionine adenosyltransferase, partial [Christensenellaceae bacterium]|nr:methionine adenosyltransferase [Christensenellaceae bacterium]